MKKAARPILRLFLTSIIAVSVLPVSGQQHLSPKREFRGVWVATVVNIDWPSRAGLDAASQQRELIQILDAHQRAGINAVMLQVRPAADALYARGREPWSRFLTGKQGQPPVPFYDPLAFAIEEARLRGMELHAWFNPYRATFDLKVEHTSRDHITRRHPEWFFTYGGKKLFNPGLPEVRDYIIQVVLDVVRNYDIDGVHFDDYFYPYPDKGKPLPDAGTYRIHGRGFRNIDDWRRNNVDRLIQTLSDSIRSVKRHVKFGISPFGIWENKSHHPEGSESNGFSGYRQLYADARKWISEGWLDYINPQIYFPFNNRAAAFEKLTNWWTQYTAERHLYIGQAMYRVTEQGAGWNDRRQLPNQIRYLRDQEHAHGSVFFSSKSLVNNLGGMRDTLQYNFYRYKALPPAMPWLDSVPPLAPVDLSATPTGNHAITLRWEAPAPANDGEQAYGYVIYRFREGEEINLERAEHILHISYDGSYTAYTDHTARQKGIYTYIVTALDRLKNESAAGIPAHVTIR